MLALEEVRTNTETTQDMRFILEKHNQGSQNEYQCLYLSAVSQSEILF